MHGIWRLHEKCHISHYFLKYYTTQEISMTVDSENEKNFGFWLSVLFFLQIQNCEFRYGILLVGFSVN